jgi:hypothetical protein
MTPYQVNVAAEAYAAFLLSTAGYDVALQYGTKQPAWDLIATKEQRTLHISVKGSQDGGWGLFANFKTARSYSEAVDAWFTAQIPQIVYLFVQFKGVAVPNSPRAYIVRPGDIVEHMRTTRAGNCDSSLLEDYTYSRGIAAGSHDLIPQLWSVSQHRIDAV